MLLIYKFLTFALYPFFIILIYIRKFFNKEDNKRFKEKIFSSKLQENKNKKRIWFHAASIGEVQSILPLVKKINENNKDINIIITTITLTSGNLIKEKLSDYSNICHKYLPLDINFLVKNFLDVWKPDMALFVDSEIWPNFLFEIKKRKVPLVLLNGRITKKTFLRWSLIPKIAKKIFQTFDLCLTSNNETKKYLENFSVKNIKNLGNIKFAAEHINLGNNFKKNFWCAVSTHQQENLICLKTHLILKEKYPNLTSIIIPRHTDKVNKIALLCEKMKLKFKILSNNEKIEDNEEIIIVNSYGSVSYYLNFCKSVFIGKSLIKKLSLVGGQNPIEAAKLGCKIYHGPYIYNFKEIYDLLSKYKISEKINDEKELSNKLDSDFNKPNIIDHKTIQDINNLGKKILNETYSELKTINML